MTAPTTTDAWLARVATLVELCRRRWPQHGDDLDDVLHHATYLARDWQRGAPVVHDGIRSPSLEPTGHSVGGHSDPVYAAVEAMDDRQRGMGTLDGPWTLERRREAARSLVTTCLLTMARAETAEQAKRNITGALYNLRTALSRTHQAMGPEDVRARVKDNGANGCTQHARLRDHKDRPVIVDASHKAGGRSGWCRWCCDQRDAFHIARIPLPALEAHQRGSRITQQDMLRWIADDKAADRKGRKGRKAS
jgi:hypothetical protein